MKHKKTLMIDLDGVLNNYIKYLESYIPNIRPGAKEFLEKLYNIEKYELVLFTTRDKILASKWLVENKIDKYFKRVTNMKEPAFLYLDDRAVQFNGDFNDTFDKIKNFKVYWKK
jgi:phosphoglycolate phosphatase-like HAD superfamily hydrolase